MNSIGVIGNGFVGSAVTRFFTDHGFDVRVFDTNPERATHTVQEVANADFVFVCVPTPTTDGVQDIRAVQEAVYAIVEHGRTRNTIVVKSTVLPGTCRQFELRNLVFNPEFLTARTAVEDFANQTDILIGGWSGGAVEPLVQLYERMWPEAAIYTMTWEEAELAKYARNTFYALKVAWWNEVFDLCEALGINYNRLIATVLASGWVNPMHCKVPGPDGQRGFGGACLPKDSQALVKFAEEKGVDLSLLRQALVSNEKVRGSTS